MDTGCIPPTVNFFQYTSNPKSEPDIWPNGRLCQLSFERQLIIYMSVDKLWIRQGEEILQTAQG